MNMKMKIYLRIDKIIKYWITAVGEIVIFEIEMNISMLLGYLVLNL